MSPHVSAPYDIAGNTQCRQVCSTVTLKDVAVLGEFCPPGRDFSLNLFDLVFVSGTVFLPQVDLAFILFYLSGVVGIKLLVCHFIVDLFIVGL